jgi:hypothetical protein
MDAYPFLRGQGLKEEERGGAFQTAHLPWERQREDEANLVSYNQSYNM